LAVTTNFSERRWALSAAACVRSQPAQPAQDAALSAQRRILRKRSGPQNADPLPQVAALSARRRGQLLAGWRRLAQPSGAERSAPRPACAADRDTSNMAGADRGAGRSAPRTKIV